MVDLEAGDHTCADGVSPAVEVNGAGDNAIAGEVDRGVVEGEAAVAKLDGDATFGEVGIGEAEVGPGIEQDVERLFAAQGDQRLVS